MKIEHESLQNNFKVLSAELDIKENKVEELEKNLTKARNQKQMLIDGLNQSLDKLKRKVGFFFAFYWCVLFNQCLI